jgi:hypothetical protein
MKSARISLLLVIALVVGCADPLAPTGSDLADADLFATQDGAAKATFEAGDFTASFVSRSFENGHTTFSYSLKNNGTSNSPNHFTIGVPECAPAPSSYSPTDGVSINSDPTTGLYGIDWHLKVSSGETQEYSVTFAGDVPLGTVGAAVRSGSVRTVDTLFGPCPNIAPADLTLTGTVFADANSDGVLNGSEVGLADITVELVDAGGATAGNATTDGSGAYAFPNLAAGSWTVRIPQATVAVDFNETLLDTFAPTSPLELVVNLDADSFGNNFGFRPEVRELLDAMNGGVLTSNAFDLTHWKVEYSNSSKGELDDEVLQQYLDAVEELFLTVPFQFNDDDEIGHAFEILSDLTDDDFVRLRKALLAAELNLVNNLTFAEADGLIEAIIAWAEGVYAENDPANASPEVIAKRSDVQDAEVLLRSYATTGGGGSNE